VHLCHRQSRHTVHSRGISPRPRTLTHNQPAIRSPGLSFDGLHPRNPHELLLIYWTLRDGRLSWPGWLSHIGQFTTTCQPQIRQDQRPNHWATRQPIHHSNALLQWIYNYDRICQKSCWHCDPLAYGLNIVLHCRLLHKHNITRAYITKRRLIKAWFDHSKTVCTKICSVSARKWHANNGYNDDDKMWNKKNTQ